MTIDAKAKGTKAESEVVKLLQTATGLGWTRSPLSGATAYCKGDIWLPPTTGKISKYCIEVKWYESDQITCNLLNKSNSTIESWWEQTEREAQQMSSKPMLIFRKNRGKFIGVIDEEIPSIINGLTLIKNSTKLYIYLLEDLLPHLKFI